MSVKKIIGPRMYSDVYYLYEPHTRIYTNLGGWSKIPGQRVPETETPGRYLPKDHLYDLNTLHVPITSDFIFMQM